MRIIGGNFKGRRFEVPSNFPVRPTTDFAREGLFNSLQHSVDIPSISVLDLFTGTGSMSLEFASRGCTNITAVDQHYGCVKHLKKLSSTLELQGVEVIRSDCFKYITHCQRQFDLVFCDPPYAFGLYNELLDLIIEHRIVVDGGMLILEHDKHTDLSNRSNFEKEKKYGNVRFSFFEINY